MDFITFQFQIKYETYPGEEIYIYGDYPDFGFRNNKNLN